MLETSIETIGLDMAGTHLRVRCADPESARAARALLQDLARAEPEHDGHPDLSLTTSGTRLLLSSGSAHIYLGPEDDVLDRLMTELNRRALEMTPHLACHAGVVSAEDRAIAIPGLSGSGKSTLVAACILAGFRYVSDEALCLRRDDGGVVPYPKPISLSAASLEHLGLAALHPGIPRVLLRAAELGGDNCETESVLTDLVLRERGSLRLEVVSRPRSDAVMELLRHAFNHYRDAGGSFRLAGSVASRCRVWMLRYQDPLEAAALLRSHLG